MIGTNEQDREALSIDFYGIWNLWFPLVQIQSSRLEEAIPPLVTNGYPLSGGNSNKKKKAYAPLS